MPYMAAWPKLTVTRPVFGSIISWPGTSTTIPPKRGHEAKRWIGFRALFREYMMREIMSEEDFAIILDHIPQIYAMAPKNESSVEGVPDRLLDLCVDKLTLTGGIDELDRIIEHLLEFRDLGVTEICLELKNHQAHGIKLLGERILPAIQLTMRY